MSNETALHSPLISYALGGLDRCWLESDGRWSHIYHLDGRDVPNESKPASDAFYTLNVLLGMSRLASVPPHLNLPEIFERNASALSALPAPVYAYGMALWSAAELGLPLPRQLAKFVRELLQNVGAWRGFRAQDLGMLLCGVIAQAQCGRQEWGRFASPLYDHLRRHYRRSSALFCDAPSGWRSRFGTFATQTYLTIATYRYGEFLDDRTAIEAAKASARKIISMQGPNGEWPWFFDAVAGRVVDFYEVYSVHQFGMAPAFLELAEKHGVDGSHEAMIKGFNWVLGQNQLRKLMLATPLQLTIRSQLRKGESASKFPRAVRALTNSLLRRSSGVAPNSQIDLRLECRSYELGWILWSFGRRADLPELTHNSAFIRGSSAPVETHSARAFT